MTSLGGGRLGASIARSTEHLQGGTVWLAQEGWDEGCANDAVGCRWIVQRWLLMPMIWIDLGSREERKIVPYKDGSSSIDCAARMLEMGLELPA